MEILEVEVRNQACYRVSERERERAGESHDRVVIVKAPVTLLELELSA